MRIQHTTMRIQHTTIRIQHTIVADMDLADSKGDFRWEQRDQPADNQWAPYSGATAHKPPASWGRLSWRLAALRTVDAPPRRAGPSGSQRQPAAAMLPAAARPCGAAESRPLFGCRSPLCRPFGFRSRRLEEQLPPGVSLVRGLRGFTDHPNFLVARAKKVRGS